MIEIHTMPKTEKRNAQMKNKGNTTHQINAYIRNQQLIISIMDLSQTIKKADTTDQDVSTFRTQAINFIKANQLNQPTRGVNQHATV